MNTVVVDAGPVIILAKAGYLHLLTEMASEILIPNRVAREILKGPPSDPARQAVHTGWGKRITVRYIPVAVRSQGLLHPGERAALALALKQSGCTVILDDDKGRKAAKNLGLQFMGTLGIIMLARKQGRVPAVTPIFHAVQAAGLYASDSLFQPLAASVGESWP